jgi:hypothetical protein
MSLSKPRTQKSAENNSKQSTNRKTVFVNIDKPRRDLRILGLYENFTYPNRKPLKAMEYRGDWFPQPIVYNSIPIDSEKWAAMQVGIQSKEHFLRKFEFDRKQNGALFFLTIWEVMSQSNETYSLGSTDGKVQAPFSTYSSEGYTLMEWGAFAAQIAFDILDLAKREVLLTVRNSINIHHSEISRILEHSAKMVKYSPRFR